MDNLLQQFVDQLRLEEEKLLSEKTTFGRNELKIVLETAKTNTIITILSQTNQNQSL